MNKRKGEKMKTLSQILFWARNQNRKASRRQYRRSDIKIGYNGSSRRTLGYFCGTLAGHSHGIELYSWKKSQITMVIGSSNY